MTNYIEYKFKVAEVEPFNEIIIATLINTGETISIRSSDAHKSKILGEAKQALIGMNISEELAKAIVLKIARGEVPNVTIQF